MVKPAEKPVTLSQVAKMVEHGFADVRAEFLKVRAEFLKVNSDIENLKNDVGHLAKATKLGFDEMSRELALKADQVDLEHGFDGVGRRLGNLDNRLDTFVTHGKRLLKVEKMVGLAV